MALLDINVSEKDSSGIVELDAGGVGSIDSINLDELTNNVIELTLVAGSGGESAFTFQS